MTSGTLLLPPKTDQRWRNLVLGTTAATPKLLALKFILSRLTLATKKDPSPANVQKSVDELYEFFQRNPRMVEADTATLFH
jgi:hypothetical protein